MDQVKIVMGGMFAPELPDDWQERYGKIIDGLPTCQTKDYMQTLYKCVKEWDALPVSEGKRGVTTHPSHPGARLVHLDKEIADSLWEHIPWREELLVMEENFLALEGQASLRYSERMRSWMQAVREHIQAKHFPEPGLYEKLSSMARKVGEFLHLLSDTSRQQVEEQLAKRQACEEEIRQAISSKSYGPIPRPERGADTTPVRDAALHLLYVVMELDCEREPIHMGQLH